MAERHVSAPGLAAMLGNEVYADTVNNWRKGTHPRPLNLLTRISGALGMGGPALGEHDPTHLLRAMSLLPEEPDEREVYALAHRVQKLDQKYRRALERSAELGRDIGAARILRAVTETGEWAAAFWPAVEGPPDCRMHVADRVDLRRLDNAPVTHQDAWDDPILHEALRDAYAVPSTRGPRWSPDDERVTRWSISHLGAPISPIRRTQHPGVASINCYAISVESWVNDIANLVALALGYGLSTTRDIAMEVTGIDLASTRPEARRAAHAHFLAAPPLRRVWSHHAPPSNDQPDPFMTARRDVFHAWIREDDELLERAAARGGQHSAHDFKRKRDELDQLTTTITGQVLVIDALATQSVADRWQQVLVSTVRVLTSLINASALADNLKHDWEHQRRRFPGVATPYLAWLERRLHLPTP